MCPKRPNPKLEKELEEEAKRREELGLPEEDLSPEEVRANFEQLEEEETEEEELEEDDTDPDLKKRLLESGMRDQKRRILAKLENQVEESGKQDEEYARELEEIRTLKQKLIEETQLSQFWQTVLSNPDWEGILRKVFTIMVGMSKGMCATTKITIERENDKLNFKFEWFDSKGRPVHTPLSDGVKEAMERAKTND